MELKSHPSRSRVLAELHARPFSAISAGARLLYFAFQVNDEEAEECLHDIERFFGNVSPLSDKRHGLFDNARVKWERHREFVSFTFEVPCDAPPAWHHTLRAPGELLVAVDLRMVNEACRPTCVVEATLVEGACILASDFQPNSSGFVEIYLTNVGMDDHVAGATVQRVLELETYRCFALLGLPVADEAAIAIARIEKSLPRVLEQMNVACALEDNRELLSQLTGLTLSLESCSAATHFRFGATRAYAQLVHLRLEVLAEVRSSGRPGLTSFFSRRFDPPIRFCVTLSDREANLARKLTRAAQLLRTRVDVALQSQNGELLSAMGERVQCKRGLAAALSGDVLRG